MADILVSLPVIVFDRSDRSQLPQQRTLCLRYLPIPGCYHFTCLSITDFVFCLASMFRVIYKKHNAAHTLRQLPFNKRREHSVLIMINIVIAIFLIIIYCALHTRCTTKFITDEFDSYICRIAVLHSGELRNGSSLRAGFYDLILFFPVSSFILLLDRCV